MPAEERPLVTDDEEAELLLRPRVGSADSEHRRWPQRVSTFGYVALGQLLSLLVCTTGVFSKRLAQAGIVAPTAQSFASYAMLGLFWSATICIRPEQSADAAATTAAAKTVADAEVRERRWKPLACLALIAAADVEANYIVVKAYSLTSFTSVQLMGCASLPLAMALSKRYLGRHYSVPHYLAVVGCVAGLVLLVLSDTDAEPSVAARAPLIGDLLCFVSGSLYAISNVGQEAVLTPPDQARGRLAAAQANETDFARATKLKTRSWLAQLGAFGSAICALQILLLERGELSALSDALRSGQQDTGWVATQAGAFGFTMFSFYSLAPLLLAARGAVFFNLSLLTTNFWAVVVGRMVFGEKVMEVEQNPSGSVSYPAGFLLIMVAVTVFNVIPDTEHAEPGRALGERHYEVGEIGNGKSAMEHPHQAKDLEQESQPLQPTRSQSQRTDDE
jgi:solute carrier family 35 protein F1/2